MVVAALGLSGGTDIAGLGGNGGQGNGRLGVRATRAWQQGPAARLMVVQGSGN